MRTRVSLLVMVLVALLVSVTCGGAQQLPSGNPLADSLSQVFLTRWVGVQNANPGMDFTRMSVNTPFIDHDGHIAHLAIGDINGPWGYVFKRTFGSDYATYRTNNPEQFPATNPDAGTNSGGNIPATLASAGTRDSSLGWIILGLFLGLVALAIIIDLIRTGLRRDAAFQEEREQADRRIADLQLQAQEERLAHHNVEQELSRALAHNAFVTDGPLPVVRDRDPIFGYYGLRQPDEERSENQVASDMDYIARTHLGPEYFIDRASIVEGVLNGPGIMPHYEHAQPLEYTSTRMFDNVRGYSAQARKGRGEDAEIVTFYTTFWCFNFVVEAGPGFTFTPLAEQVTPTVAEVVEFPGRISVDGGTVVGSEFDRSRLTAITIRTPRGGQYFIPTTGAPIIDESGHATMAEPETPSANGSGVTAANGNNTIH